MPSDADEPEQGGEGTGSGDSIPTTGATDRPTTAPPGVPVKPARIAVGAAVLAALYLFAVYRAHPLPRFVARTLGVHEGEVAKLGGLRMTWLPPAGFDTTALMDHLYARAEGGYMGRDGDAIVIVIPGIREADVATTAERITNTSEGLAFREVVQTDEMKQLPGVEIDQWRDEERDEPHTDYYLFAPTRDEIEAKLADAAKTGWKLPAGTHIAYEHLEATDMKPAGFRTYVVRDEAEIDGWSVARAMKSYNPNTNRPEVLVDFDEQGARRFAEVTERMVGKKLAIMVRGQVSSAPIINSAIRGGRAAITMGGTDPRAAERDADDLVSTLDYGALPPGGRVVEARYQPPTGNPARLWIARILLALLGGALAGAIVWLVVRWAQPTTRRRRVWTGEAPWLRVLVSLAAPAAILLVSRVGIYGTDPEELAGVGGRKLAEAVTIGSIGIMPVITAFILVEIVAALIPGWARRRHAGPIARQPIQLTVGIVAVALVAFQGWFFAQYLHAAGFINPGVMPRILVMASLAGGTAILVATAAIIRWQGLGNGYGALFAGGWLVVMLHRWATGPLLSAEHVIGGMTILVIAVAIGVVLRWRVGQLRVPTSSIAPLADAGGIVAILALLSQFPLEQVTAKAVDWSQHLHDRAPLLIALVIVLTIVWSLAFGRPSAYAGQPAPSWATWQRATTVSMLLLVGLAVVVAATGSLVPDAAWMADAATLAVVVAYALDAYDDFQARRARLVVAWTLHQPHHADAAEQALADAGIASHMSASHLRALLSFFGPFAPIEVLVPVEHAQAARDKLAALVPQ